MTATPTRRFLVVDDDPPQRYLARLALEAAYPDAVVDEAPDGYAALDWLHRRDPRDAFLVVDRQMPGLDGEHVLRRALAKGARGTLWTSAPVDCGLPCVAKPSDWRGWCGALMDAVGAWARAVA